jgi:polysaccharide export outer membrane protein
VNPARPLNGIQRMMLFFLLLFTGCASGKATMPPVATPPPAAMQVEPEYTIQPGDELDIKLFYNPELNESLTVRPDGKISMQLIDEIQAAGLTPGELDQQLTEKYSRELKKPAVTVIVKSFINQQVFVGGEVNQQGFVKLTAGMTPLQAVLGAGGIKETGDLSSAIIIRKGPENQPVPVTVNLKQAIFGGKQAAMQLQPQDVVYVPKTAIAEVNKFVKQYIEDLLLFRGVSLGFSYSINDHNNN